MVLDSKDVFGQQGFYNASYCASEDERQSNSKEIKKKNESLADNGKNEERRKKNENFQIWRSIICSSLSLNLSFSAFLTLMNSITSLLPDKNVAIPSLITSNVSQSVATAFFIAFFNKAFGMKRMLLLATLLLFIYTAAFLYPIPGVFIPVSLGMGISTATDFTNGFAYSNALGYWYYKVNGGNLDTILSLLSGFTNGCIGGGVIWGNLIYYQVLKTDYVDEYSNITDFRICGASYCNEDLRNSSIAKPPPSWKVNNLIYIFLGIIGMAFILRLFIVDINKSSDTNKKDFFTILKNSYLLYLNPGGFLLILITLFLGMERQFIAVVFTNAYITCIHGPAVIGYVMIYYGAAQIIASFSVSLVVKLLGRPAVVVLAFASFICIFTVLLSLPAERFTRDILCIISFVYGVTDSLMISSICSLYGLMFPDNLGGAFSLFTLWFTFGHLTANSLNMYTCIYMKLYILLAVEIVGTLSYYILEYMIYKKYFN